MLQHTICSITADVTKSSSPILLAYAFKRLTTVTVITRCVPDTLRAIWTLPAKVTPVKGEQCVTKQCHHTFQIYVTQPLKNLGKLNDIYHEEREIKETNTCICYLRNNLDLCCTMLSKDLRGRRKLVISTDYLCLF